MFFYRINRTQRGGRSPLAAPPPSIPVGKNEIALFLKRDVFPL